MRFFCVFKVLKKVLYRVEDALDHSTLIEKIGLLGIVNATFWDHFGDTWDNFGVILIDSIPTGDDFISLFSCSW